MSFSDKKHQAKQGFSAIITATTYTVDSDKTGDVFDSTVLLNPTGNHTLTMPDPTTEVSTNRVIVVVNYSSHSVSNSAANIIPLTGGAAGTAMLAAAGSGTFKSNGQYWYRIS